MKRLSSGGRSYRGLEACVDKRPPGFDRVKALRDVLCYRRSKLAARLAIEQHEATFRDNGGRRDLSGEAERGTLAARSNALSRAQNPM
jgi:hypothetical protein